MANDRNQRKAFAFLHDRAKDGTAFTAVALESAAGWKANTLTTYASKQFKAYFETTTGGYRVRARFKRVRWEEFRDLVTQVKHPLAEYERSTYQSVVVYDFLMPLTREDKLRKALDELFYRDTLERRIEEVGLDVLAKTVPRNDDDDLTYRNRIIQFIDDRIGGFSISHVSGRFRVGAILSRREAGEQLAGDKAYLIDETTAVVRFIIPCLTSVTKHAADFELAEPAGPTDAQVREIAQIRGVFFEVFVEGLVPTIRGEKLIWMLETTRLGQRLYELRELSFC